MLFFLDQYGQNKVIEYILRERMNGIKPWNYKIHLLNYDRMV